MWWSSVLVKALSLQFTVISLVIQKVMIFWNFTGVSRIQSIVYNLRVLGHFETENYVWKLVIIESISEFWQFFLVWYFFEPKCPNICNTYYSQKNLRYFGVEILIVYRVLEHLKIYQVFMYNFLCWVVLGIF